VGTLPPTNPVPSSSGPASEHGVRVDGARIFVDGAVFHIRGVNWNPVPKGQTHPAGLAYAELADIDIPLMKAAGINAVRTYERLEDRAVLDKLQAAGIYVFSTVLGWWQDEPGVVVERVNRVKDHPAILGWVLGNEWNYNHLYGEGNLTEEQTRDMLNEAAALIKSLDDTHLVTTIWGGTPPKSIVDAMPDIDVWGLNVYSGISFGNTFTEFAAVSSKPMYFGEYGADAWDTSQGAYAPAAQAAAVKQLTQEIFQHLVTEPSGVTSGGFVFEWADEWWKDGDQGQLNVQGTGGVAPGGGPYPDGTFNEEWWGIVDIDRNPRPAYEELKLLYAP
jgi:Glycosyl hydrolases family 2, TIM barrel domain